MFLPVRYVVGQALLIGIGVYQNNLFALARPLDTEIGSKGRFAGPTLHTPNKKLHDWSSWPNHSYGTSRPPHTTDSVTSGPPT